MLYSHSWWRELSTFIYFFLFSSTFIYFHLLLSTFFFKLTAAWAEAWWDDDVEKEENDDNNDGEKEENDDDDDEQCHLGIVAFLSTSKPRRRPLNPLSALYLQQ